MTSPRRTVRTLALAGFLACAVAPVTSEAQQTRVQVAGTQQLSSELHLMLGADEVIPLGGGPCLPGGPPCTPPDFDLLVGAYGGFMIDEVPLSIYAHVGVQYKLSSDFGLGLLAFGFSQPFQGGPAVRLDALDVAALKVGYAWGTEDGVMIGIETAGEFILDLFR